jgi:hypothetical protein
MNHPDFRVGGRIFASLDYPDGEHGMVKLTPLQQRAFVKKAPNVFSPCAGSWGTHGATNVHLPSARVELLRSALDAASKNAAPKKNG